MWRLGGGEKTEKRTQNLKKTWGDIIDIVATLYLVEKNVETGTDVPKDVAADVAQIYREEAAMYEVMRKIFAAKKNDRTQQEAEQEAKNAHSAAKAWRRATEWAMKAGRQAEATKDAQQAQAAADHARRAQVDSANLWAKRAADQAKEEAALAAAALTKKIGL